MTGDGVDPGRRSMAKGRPDGAEPRCAGASAWIRAQAIAGVRARAERAAARRYRARMWLVALATAVVAWSAAAASWPQQATSSVVTVFGLAVCVGAVAFGVRGVLADRRLAGDSRSAARYLAAIASTSFNDVDGGCLPAAVASGTGARHGDVEGWVALALARRPTADALRHTQPNLCWWHDVRLRADPSIVFDHVSVGASGVVFVHDVVVTTGHPLTVDGVNGLSYAGCPNGAPGADPLMAWQLRAASTLARTVGLGLPTVTVIAVVSNAGLVDVWGARTEIEELRHIEAQVALTYCTPQRLPDALLTDCHLEPDVATLAAHRLAEAIAPNAAEVIHRLAARRTIALWHRRRYGRSEQQEVRHG